MISPTFSYFSARLSAVFDAVRSTNSSPPYLISLVSLSFESTKVLIQFFDTKTEDCFKVILKG